MKDSLWERNLFELIRRTSTELPADVVSALRKALDREKKGSHAWWALDTMLRSTDLARRDQVPLCQDTGTLTFYFNVPVGFDSNALVARTRAAVASATKHGFLRENTIDAVTGASYPTNIAHASPVIHVQQCARRTVDVRLLMKGGGCENVGMQYSLPDASLKAERDMDGVRRCILDAVFRAQGRGCSPGVLGVCIGGDRATGFAHAKEQFLHKVGERSRYKALALLEEQIMREAASFEIGPMGLGGKTSLLGVKIGAASRLPASFFVTVSYMCWCFRRRGLRMGPGGGIQKWLYR
jgi:fumarate hydratase class I